MIIKRLQLNNFGVYAGLNEFDFVSNKPVVLIGGMNGRGKTTFLEAVLLALYGSNSFAYAESDQKSYSQYLRSFVNRNSEDNISSVELEFEINTGIKESYVVKRQWETESKRPKEQIFVFKDGERNEFLTNNWAMFVENILPSALSSFFFFDGEKIAELAVDNTNIQLKNSIRSMLGISVLDVLNNDIMRNLKKVNRTELSDKSKDKIQQLRDEKEETSAQVAQIEDSLMKANQKLIKDNDALEKLHQLYAAKGGDAVEKQQEVLKQRAECTAEMNAAQEQIYGLVADALPLALVDELISDIKLQATDEHSDFIMQEALKQLDVLFDEFSSSYSGKLDAGRKFIEYVKNQTGNRETETIYGLSEQALFQVNSLVESVIEDAVTSTKDTIRKKNKIIKKINELDSYLTLDVNDKELKGIYKKIKAAEQKIIEDKVVIAELEQKRSSATSRLMIATSEFSKCVEAYLSTAELSDSTDRVVKYSNMALNIIERYQIELQKRKTDVLAKTITDCYKKLANKKNLIKSIKMDPETLDLSYLAADDEVIPKDSLSAGEKQLMVISILWALAICSKKKLPVIIDTPLSRLDSSHRAALITTYFPNAGEQTIILSTDTEIDSNYYKMMKKNVGDEFTLNYNEELKSTSIERGYKIGANK
ncbi:DNA sulfur modification protein DndD [Lachnospiraceae bacterium XBB2008]|nr:DNA sulfur modification protein DndD [Lachnospiraceae bacterium XBB2008]